MRRAFATLFFLLGAAHIVAPSRVAVDWATLVLLGGAVGLAFAPQILKAILPSVESLEWGKFKLKLRQELQKLSADVTQLENPKQLETKERTIEALPQDQIDQLATLERNERLADTSVESKILSIAARDKFTAILQLGLEIEAETLLLSAMLGLRSQARVGTVREATQILNQYALISDDTKATLLEFWRLRNKVAHAEYPFAEDDPVLNSFLDDGLRLLRLIKAIPRPIYRVRQADVPLFKDEKCTERIHQHVGVLLDVTNADGTKGLMILPAGRKFQAGEVVGWDWDRNTKLGPAYYIHPDTKEPTKAWDNSIAFKGLNEDLRFNALRGEAKRHHA